MLEGKELSDGTFFDDSVSIGQLSSLMLLLLLRCSQVALQLRDLVIQLIFVAIQHRNLILQLFLRIGRQIPETNLTVNPSPFQCLANIRHHSLYNKTNLDAEALLNRSPIWLNGVGFEGCRRIVWKAAIQVQKKGRFGLIRHFLFAELINIV